MAKNNVTDLTVADFLSTLEAEHVDYAVLRNYEDLPDVGNDLDIVVRKKSLNRIIDMLKYSTDISKIPMDGGIPLPQVISIKTVTVTTRLPLGERIAMMQTLRLIQVLRKPGMMA